MTKKKKTAVYFLRIMIEAAVLALIVLLIKNNKLQVWLAVFAAGAAVSLLAGRFFCGWICPMETLFRPIRWIYAKLGIKRFHPPRFLQKQWVRIAVLILFISSLVLSRILKVQIPLLLYLIIFSVVLSLFFTEELWHRYLCPYGTILSITSRLSPKGLHIDREACISCRRCLAVCPSGSIEESVDGKYTNKTNECLLCYNCAEVCPVEACRYSTVRKKRVE